MSFAKLSLPDFQRAAEAGEIFLMYQPKLTLRTGAIDGVEALARWQHPRNGALEPARFIRSAELCGAIDWFTEWALEQAIRQWSAWREKGLDLAMAVNISALNLKHFDFPDMVEALCERGGMPNSRLTLELTEGATQKALQLMDNVARMRLKGFDVSLDDFGTGYGSMLQLRKLPFTELKIDRNFIADLQTSRHSRAITRSLIALAHEFGLGVTAEGVEDYQTLETLTAFGCDKAQGFLIARPMTGERLALWLPTWQEATPERQRRRGARTATGGSPPPSAEDGGPTAAVSVG
jgi:EAL domain-containing protein (putative c-di-GMP-specific phosphodiesterase class I)